MAYTSIIFSIVFAVLLIVLLWRIYVLWNIIHTGRKNHLYTHISNTHKPLSIFFSKPIVGILHTMLVGSMIIMTVHAIIHACGIHNILWETITIYSSYAAIVAATLFISRRIRGLKRFSSLSPRQRQDGYIILSLEIISAITLLAYYHISPTWYMWHYVTILCFAIYITYSKHLHIVISIPYMIQTHHKGVFDTNPLPQISAALDMMEGKTTTIPMTEKMGVSLYTDLTHTDIEGILSCTQCGRCTEICPPHIAGENFSPMDIIYKIRLSTLNKKPLYPDTLSLETISTCISCGACIVSCPIGINPMDILWQIKRYATLEEGHLPLPYHTAAQSTQNSSYPLPTQLDTTR